MIRCNCGMYIDDDVGITACPRCGSTYPSQDYRAAHIPARPETEVVGGDNAPLPGGGVEPRTMNTCPECEKGAMIPSEGCAICPVCGYSPCSG